MMTHGMSEAEFRVKVQFMKDEELVATAFQLIELMGDEEPDPIISDRLDIVRDAILSRMNYEKGREKK